MSICEFNCNSRDGRTCAQKARVAFPENRSLLWKSAKSQLYIRLVCVCVREAAAAVAAVCAVGCNTRQTESVYWRLGCFLRAVWPQSGHYSGRRRLPPPPPRRSNLPPRSLDPASNSPSVCAPASHSSQPDTREPTSPFQLSAGRLQSCGAEMD